jgi:hypothetical protein
LSAGAAASFTIPAVFVDGEAVSRRAWVRQLTHVAPDVHVGGRAELPELEVAIGVRRWILRVVLHSAVSPPWSPPPIHERSLVVYLELLTVFGDLLNVSVDDSALALVLEATAIFDLLSLASIVRPLIREVRIVRLHRLLVIFLSASERGHQGQECEVLHLIFIIYKILKIARGLSFAIDKFS